MAAAEAGHATALSGAAGMLREAGRAEEATAVYQQAAEGGDTTALEPLATILEKTGRTGEATAVY
jgi:hypothetical protein